MSEFERYGGELHNIKPTLQNRTVAEQIDDYQMKIYALMKHAYPQVVGYTADCHEITDDKGKVIDIHTRFFMDKGGEGPSNRK